MRRSWMKRAQKVNNGFSSTVRQKELWFNQHSFSHGDTKNQLSFLIFTRKNYQTDLHE